jgi:hypothetical protein
MNVYWSVLPVDESITPLVLYDDPRPIQETINKIDLGKSPVMANNFKQCPAVGRLTHNTYSLRFPFDYKLILDNLYLRSPMYNQQFFDTVMLIRSPEARMFSMNLHYIFVAEESLEMSITPSIMSDNDFVNKTMVIPGQFDIGRWVRPLDCAFIIKNEYNDITINKDDEFLNVKFLTDKKVTLKKFLATDLFKNLADQNVSSKSFKKKTKGLQYYYNLYQRSRLHNIMMREIKNNLIDELL